MLQRSTTSLIMTTLEPQATSRLIEPIIEIASGRYSTVTLAKLGGNNVVIKTHQPVTDTCKNAGKYLENEFRVLKMLSDHASPNTVKLLGYIGDEASPESLVLQFYPGMSLDTWIEEKSFPQPTWRMKLGIALHIIRAIVFLHQLDLVHRDIKIDNVFIDNFVGGTCQAVLGDFGFTVAESIAKSEISKGTAIMMAPECLIRQPSGKPSDIYSFSLLFWIVCAWKNPFEGYDFMSFLKLIVDGKREELPSNWPAGISSLIARGWAHLPDSRPTANNYEIELNSIPRNVR